MNPEDRHSPLVIHFHGQQHVNLSLDVPDHPEGLPSERFRMVLNDPLAAAEFYAHLMEAFCGNFVGFRRNLTLNTTC